MNTDAKKCITDFSAIMWNAPKLLSDILQGDMPGDKISIHSGSIEKANTIFIELMKLLQEFVSENPTKAVVSVYGGSGVGKTTIASLLTYYLNDLGIGSYTLSGDNYPRRLPIYNDAERLHLFREGGLLKLIEDHSYTEERAGIIKEFQLQEKDADVEIIQTYPWYASYILGGIHALQDYLGTEKEINFSQLNDILNCFKMGKEKIWLKRMGKAETDIWYEEVDFSTTNVLILEWTHGNSKYLKNVDIPIFLNSTPQETLEYRKARNRNSNTDTSFITRVLEIEQRLLYDQSVNAKLIVSKDGEILSKEDVVYE